jgi:hypothetical protein
MKHIRDREIYAHIHTIIDMLKRLYEETSQDSTEKPSSQLIKTVLQYIFTKGNTQNKALFLNDIVEGLQEPIGDEVMSIAKQFIEEGISIGVSRGVIQERTEILIDQLKNKFGGISIHYKMLIASSSSEELKKWLSNILWAKSIEPCLNPIL